MKISKSGIALATLALSVVSLQAMAETPCTMVAGGTGVNGKEMAIAKIDGYKIEFSPSVSIGTVIHRNPISVTSLLVRAACPGGVQNVVNKSPLVEEGGPYNTYATTVRGVGVRMRYQYQDMWWPQVIPQPGNEISWNRDPLIIEFVKTGPITAKGSLEGELAGIYLRNGSFQMVSIQIAGKIEINPRVPSCTVDRGDIPVDLSGGGPLARSLFTGEGSVSPERKFSIDLTCTGGDPDTSTNVHVTITDASRHDNTSNLLSLDSTSSASGVAIQVLRNDMPISFGPDSNAAGTTNQWKAGTVMQGTTQFSIPLSARYIQVDPTVKAGTANASATFTMSYQ
jgi:type 1 fimbria pilin